MKRRRPFTRTPQADRPPRRLADALALDLVVAAATVVLVALAGTAAFLLQQINDNSDAELVESAHRLMDVAMHQIERDLHPPAAAPGPSGAPARSPSAYAPYAPPASPLLSDPPLMRDDGLVFQLVDAQGRVWLRSPAAPVAAFGIPLRAGFHDLDGWRIYAAAHPGMPLFLLLADPQAERTEAVAWAMGVLTLAWALMLAALAVLLVWRARRRVGVVSALQRQIATRGVGHLPPLSLDNLPAELADLARDVNALLARLHEALQVERALAANAAHELRTPLAAAQLRLAAAMADGVGSEHVAAAHQALASLQHRTEKLLQLSRAESPRALDLQALNLDDIATSVAQEAWQQWPAAQRQLDLLLAGTNATAPNGTPMPPLAWAEPDALAIALRNLIENALRHAGGAAIELVVQAPATLTVRDGGPGVAPERLAHLRERHVRASADRTGFGLGLSIVASVAAKLGARLELRSPPEGRANGFEARLVLHPAQRPPASSKPAA